MALIYKLVGFDRVTEALAVTHDIPRNKVSQAKRIAGIADRRGIIADWPLSLDQPRAITDLIGAKIDRRGPFGLGFGTVYAPQYSRSRIVPNQRKAHPIRIGVLARGRAS